MESGYFLPVIPLRAVLGSAGSAAEEEYFRLVERLLLPLLRVLERLEDDGTGYGLTLVLPPALLAWFEQPAAAARLAERLRVRVRSAEIALLHKQSAATKTFSNPTGNAAEAWLEGCRDRLFWFEEQYARQLGKALQRLASFGNLELIPTTATYCALPLLRAQPSALQAQILAAKDDFCVSFGTQPHGIWLPECAYFPGLEEPLARAGFSYTFASSESFASAQAPLSGGDVNPVLAGEKQLAIFALQAELTAQIASAKNGYYKDPVYLQPTQAFAEGAEWRGRDDGDWCPTAARQRADQHAGHYLTLLQDAVEHTRKSLSAEAAPAALVVAVDGAFWSENWLEGVEFLDFLMRKAHYDQNIVHLSTSGRYLKADRRLQTVLPGEAGRSGQGLFAAYYAQGADALLPELQMAAETLRTSQGPGRLLRQMGRELLLAQEWRLDDPEESLREARRHLARFCALEQSQHDGSDSAELLAGMEAETPIFIYLDVDHFQAKNSTTP